LEVAHVLRKKIYVTAAKLRLLQCLELPAEDMQWFTLNEHESHIHVVPMWTIASFKRLKQLSHQYSVSGNSVQCVYIISIYETHTPVVLQSLSPVPFEELLKEDNMRN